MRDTQSTFHLLTAGRKYSNASCYGIDNSHIGFVCGRSLDK